MKLKFMFRKNTARIITYLLLGCLCIATALGQLKNCSNDVDKMLSKIGPGVLYGLVSYPFPTNVPFTCFPSKNTVLVKTLTPNFSIQTTYLIYGGQNRTKHLI